MSAPDHLSGLTTESRHIIQQFFQWSKLSLDKFKRELSVEASAFASGNLHGIHYHRDDVAHMLQGQLTFLQDLVNTQVDSSTAAAAEVMRAVLREADRQRLTLTVDTAAVLSNAGGVKAMERHGQQLLSGPTGRLAPLTLADASGEAGRQLQDANEEVRRLQKKLQTVTDAYTNLMAGRSEDTAQLLNMHDAMLRKDIMAEELARRVQGSSGDVQTAVQQLRLEVAAANKELAQRLNQSSQYQQVKALLTTRNNQLRVLRDRLRAVDPSFEQEDDIISEGD